METQYSNSERSGSAGPAVGMWPLFPFRMHQGWGVFVWVQVVDARFGVEGMVPPWPLQRMPSGTLPSVEGKEMHSVVSPQIGSFTVQLNVVLCT